MWYLVRVVASKGRRADQYRAKKRMQTLITVGLVVEQRHGVVGSSNSPLHCSPILIRLFLAIGAALQHLAGYSRVDLRLGQRGGNLELQYLLMLTPVNYEAKLDKIEPGEFRYVEDDFRILPGGPLTSDPGDRPVLNHRG